MVPTCENVASCSRTPMNAGMTVNAPLCNVQPLLVSALFMPSLHSYNFCRKEDARYN